SLDAQVSVPDPNALLVFDSQRVLTKAPDDTFANVENAQWADNLPKLLQARIVQSFSNAKQLRMVSRPMDDLNADYKLAIEIRSFQIALGKEPVAEVNFTARILGSDGKVVAAQDFKAQEPAKSAQVGDAIPALNAAFGRAATELVKWTVGTL
ncbi:MAG: membrane integrity-associated transporter subunit PqiC, partial [Rhizobiales bacterium]|nr:membrane integrity-associated transporter subunit PqiC [Hyphomicrobiales bacterium]